MIVSVVEGIKREHLCGESFEEVTRELNGHTFM